MQTFINAAIKEALKSSYCVRVGAITIKGNKIVGKGFNKLKTNPMLRVKYGYYSIHAECASIMNANQGDTLLVVRVLKDGTISCAKPCNKCVAFARDNGIKKIIYSDWDSSFKFLDIE